MFRSSVKTPPTEVLPGVNTLVKLAILPPAERVAAPVGGFVPAVFPPAYPSSTAVTATVPPLPATLMQLPSRVEDVEPAGHRQDGRSLLYVAAPHYAGDLEVPEPGTGCRVIWPTPVGLCELPTRFTGRVLVGPGLRAWRLVVNGPVQRTQRRRYFRVPWIGPVTLEVSDDGSRPEPLGPVGLLQHDDPDGADAALIVGPGEAGAGSLQVLTGMTLDLSEGGLRVALPTPGLPDATAIRVLLPVYDQVLVLPATTVWHRPAPTPNLRQVELGVSFDDVEEHGDLLRQVVFEAQLQARRTGVV